MKRSTPEKKLLKSDPDISDKRVPLRTCVGCGSVRPREELIRIVAKRDENGAVNRLDIDRSGRMNGRGAYLCADASCMDLAARKNGFNRSFKCTVPREAADELKERLSALKEVYEAG